MDDEIRSFTESIGAVDLREIEEFRVKFKRSNYFCLEGNVLVVKISRSERPFWGVRRCIIDCLNGCKGTGYFLILLTSAREGFIFNKNEANHFISSKKWALASDDDYKINSPLPNKNAFSKADQVKQLISGT